MDSNINLAFPHPCLNFHRSPLSHIRYNLVIFFGIVIVVLLASLVHSCSFLDLSTFIDIDTELRSIPRGLGFSPFKKHVIHCTTTSTFQYTIRNFPCIFRFSVLSYKWISGTTIGCDIRTILFVFTPTPFRHFHFQIIRPSFGLFPTLSILFRGNL